MITINILIIINTIKKQYNFAKWSSFKRTAKAGAGTGVNAGVNAGVDAGVNAAKDAAKKI